MTDTGSTSRPEDSGLLRRARFVRQEPMPAEPLMTATEYRLADTLQRAVDDRLEEALRAIEEQATSLMREVATEIWRSSSRDVRPEQERIVALLSRDQAIRSLIASSDERFQALAVRTARLEDHLHELSEGGRTTREAFEASAKAIRDIAASPSLQGIETVRSQLEQVERHIAEAFMHMNERDRELKDTVLTQVRDHGDLIAQETTRVVEAMQSYVQGGAEAVGRLAQRIEEHAAMFINADHDITERVRGIVMDETADLTQQIGLVAEKVGLHGRNQELMRAAVERTTEYQAMGLAQLVRSDSKALQRLIEQRTDEMRQEMRETAGDAVVERMELFDRMAEERTAALERTIQEQVVALSTATAASMERNVERMVESIGALDGMDSVLVESQSAAQERLVAQLGDAHERLTARLSEAQEQFVTRMVDAQATVQERMLADVGQTQGEVEERMRSHMDDRMTAIARLIRSDNQVLAERFAALQEAASSSPSNSTEPAPDAELMRQVLRALKELEAGLASDMLGTMDRRFQTVADQLHKETQSTAEAMVKIAEILGEKIDRLTVRVDEGVGGEMQVIVDRMSDAIQALTSQRRQSA